MAATELSLLVCFSKLMIAATGIANNIAIVSMVNYTPHNIEVIYILERERERERDRQSERNRESYKC